MTTPAFTRLAAGIVFLCLGASAATYYVDQNNASPTAPFGDWTTAATNIQDAVDLATDGDLILVTNGTYATGGRPFYGSLTNRVVIDKAVTVQSVNGPAVTIIQGNPVLDDTAVRCVYMTNGASLIGFTLTQGATRNFQGDMYLEWRGGGAYCESTNAMISNCVFSANSAANGGGGIIGGTLESCILSSNATTVNYLGGNGGGGALGSTLNHCVLIGNSAFAFGGGADSCTLNFCVLGGNSAGDSGGGVIGGTLNNCILTNNSAGNVGGGADGATLNSCNLTGNSAYAAGGAVYGTLNNCIVYYNQTIDPYSPNYDAAAMNRCCTTPHAGTGNFTNEPLFVNYAAGDFHLQSGSFCINAGDNASVATGVDWDGNPRVVGTYVDVGAFEYQSAAPLPLSASAFADFTNVASGFVVNLIGEIGGHETLSFWDFGDGTFVTNQLNLSHGWSAAGDYTVTLTAYDSDHPSGVSASLMVHVLANPVYYVSLDNGTPAAPYSSWATAANSIQDAVDAAYAGATVWVSNGIYQTGGKITLGGTSNRVAVTAPMRIHSINGPAVTVIKGYVPPTTNSPASVRCVCLSSAASLSGFTLTNGSSYSDAGGGALITGGSLSNCVIVGNYAKSYGGGTFGGLVDHCIIKQNFAQNGGGAAAARLINNLVFSNTAAVNGGGVFGVNATNCTVVGNYSVMAGGGCFQGALQNCIVYFNSIGAANATATNNSGSFMSYCCTKPSPNVGNITNDPAFANLSGADYHLTAVSPCINGGTNIWAADAVDFDANPRLMFDCVDIGAYEFQSKIRYVKPPMLGATPVAPYTNWVTAATNIQSAIDAAVAGEFVVVSNGFYNSGGRVMFGAMTNRIVVTNGVMLMGLNGAAATVIVGGSQTRCAYLGSNSVLFGITLSNGLTRTTGDLTNEQCGGGAWCETGAQITNCWIVGNSANYRGGGVYSGSIWNSTFATNMSHGGGAAVWSTLVNCLLKSNAVPYSISYGGGAYECTLSNCTLIGNGWAYGAAGGGAYHSKLYNCALLTNSAAYGGGGVYASELYNCSLIGNQDVNGFGGGGVYGGLTVGCTLIGNKAAYGAGAYSGVLSNCVVTGNQSTSMGGGAYLCTNYNSVFVGNVGLSGGGAAGNSLASGISAAYNCVFSNNIALQSGGGSYQCTLSNCVLFGNKATNSSSSYAGGGVYQGTLYNCLIVSNTAGYNAGGVYQGVLYNCTVVGNSATNAGGGTYGGSMYNSIIYYNWASSGSNYSGSGLFSYCCSLPLPPGGFGFTNAPVFVNAWAGDFHEQNNSPTINGGGNGSLGSVTNDLDGNARIVGGTVDVGAYEYQGANNTVARVPIHWLQQYGLPTDGSADFLDSDGDGLNNWQEWIAGTTPTDAASVLRLLSANPTNDFTQTTITWQSAAGKNYSIERASDLAAHPAFATVQSNIVGFAGTTSFTDTNAIGNGPFFYRVGVQ